MEFGFIEEDQMSSKGKLPNFSYSSSSSPSSSPSPQRKISSQLVVPLGQIYRDNHHQNQQQHHHQFCGSWLSNRYDPAEDEEEDTSRINETSTAGTTAASSAAAAKLDLMDVDDVEEDGSNKKVAESSSDLVLMEKEHMFDKVVTPSDVGKLNRLVIPKQHAERCFPLDSTTNEKGLLLNFEDRNGKSWRFRYSYWNSSQSYVMTKGWSRFVKEKKLDAGDIVSFQRGVGELGKDRLYIDWRRRPEAVPDYGASHQHNHHGHHGHLSSIPWSPLLMRPPTVPVVLPRDHLNLSNSNYRNNAYYNVGGGGGGGGCSYGYGYRNYSNNNHPYSSSAGSSVVYLRSSTPLAPQQVGMGMVQWQFGGGVGGATGGVVEPMVYESVPVVQGKAAAKRLRLFGVNMDCPITTDHQSDHDQFDKTISSTTTLPHNSTSVTLQQLPSPQLASQPQFKLYRGTPLPAAMRSSSTQFLHKGKSSSSSSSVSLDLDI